MIGAGPRRASAAIAAKDPKNPPAGFRWFELLERSEGYVAYALRSDDVVAEATRLRAADLDASDVVAIDRHSLLWQGGEARRDDGGDGDQGQKRGSFHGALQWFDRP